MVWGLNTLLDVSAELYHQVLCQCIQVIVKYVFFFFFQLAICNSYTVVVIGFRCCFFFFFLVGCLFFSGRGKKKIHCVSRSPTLYRYFQFFHPYLIIERFLIRFPVKNYFLEQVLFPVVGGSSYFFFVTLFSFFSISPLFKWRFFAIQHCCSCYFNGISYTTNFMYCKPNAKKVGFYPISVVL